MEKQTEETAVNLMQLMLDEDWVREAVRIEEEAGCDIGAISSSFFRGSTTTAGNVVPGSDSRSGDDQKG